MVHTQLLPPYLHLTFSALSVSLILHHSLFSSLLSLLIYLSISPVFPYQTHTQFEPCSPQTSLSSTLLPGRHANHMWCQEQAGAWRMWCGSLVTICFHSPHPANMLKHLHALTLLWLVAVLKEETEKQRVWESFGVPPFVYLFTQ